MTQRSLPWAGTDTGDHGPYSDQDWKTLQQHFFGWGNDRPGGAVFLSDQNSGLWVSEHAAGADLSVDVSPGSALIRGIGYISDEIETLTIETPHSTYDRLDMVVLQADIINQTVRLAVKTGTPAATPLKPTLDQSAAPYYEEQVAIITAPAASSEITKSDIQPVHNYGNLTSATLAGVTNTEGADLNFGEVVVWDSGSANAVKYNALGAGTDKAAGIVIGMIPNAETGRIATFGKVRARISGSVAAGALLQASITVPGRLQTWSIGAPCARALSAGADGDFIWVMFAPGALGDSEAVASIKAFAVTSPAGWVAANGQALSRSVYKRLFDVIGTTFGVGDGSTTFNVPDLRGRTAIGIDNMGGTPANRVTDGQADVLGGVMGEEKHQLTVGELASHTHPVSVGYVISGGAVSAPDYHTNYQGVQQIAAASGASGSNTPHNNVQPSMALFMCIRT